MGNSTLDDYYCSQFLNLNNSNSLVPYKYFNSGDETDFSIDSNDDPTVQSHSVGNDSEDKSDGETELSQVSEKLSRNLGSKFDQNQASEMSSL